MIHPSAQIDSTAKIDQDVSIGPYTVVGPNVVIKAATKIEGNAFSHNHTNIG